MRATQEAIEQIQALRTRYPWAVVGPDQTVIAVFNYRAEAKEFARRDPDNRTAFDASGVIFDALSKQA